MQTPVVFLASGTRGDVLPYLALAQAGQEAGLATRLAAHRSFLPLAQDVGVEVAWIGPNPTDLLHVPGAMPLTYNGNPIQSLRSSLAYMHAARPAFRQLLDQAWVACQGAGMVIVGLPTWWGLSIAEALGIPGIMAPLQPLTRTRAYPTALQPFSGSLGRQYNRLTHWLAEQALWQGWRGEINAWRKRIGLGSLPFTGPFTAWYAQEIPFIYGISPHVFPRPADWPETHRLAGYWPPSLSAHWQPAPGLVDFLEQGEKPVYIGFGSMQQTRQMLEVVINAVQKLGLRAVVALGTQAWEYPLPGTLYPLVEAPHTWLFPQVRAAVHHGGAGTTAASLRAGLPTGVVPVGVDQFFWGERVHTLGVGPRPVPQRTMTVEQISRMLATLVEDREMQNRAARLGEALRSEDGIREAIKQIRERV